MPRIDRGLADGLVYHIINRGNGRQKVFHSRGDYGVFIELICKGQEFHPVIILGYCLMPNHFHMILKTVHAEDLSKFMQWVMTSHVRKYHSFHNTSGHIWQGRFKNFVIQADEYLLMALRYVEGNPHRAGLVSSARLWPWSSHLERIGETREKGILGELPVVLPCDWGRYVDEPFSEKELDRVRRSVVRQSPFGSEEWGLKTAEELGLKSTLKPRGRPRHGGTNDNKEAG